MGRLLLLVFLSLSCTAKETLPLKNLRRSIFKIYVVSKEPRFNQPWLFESSGKSTGSGFYIGNSRIMTNAHVVSFGRYITVQRDGDARPTPAYVEYIAHDSDLAILKVGDSAALEGSTPLKFGKTPSLRDKVATVGYPRGGEQISITEGVVSRISYRRYAHPGYDRHLLVQVDSAINPGNSGGPVFKGDQVVGVAFQSHTKAENTGYIIPTVVVERFLDDIKDGSYEGHPKDGLVLMNSALENEATRRFHGSQSNGGVKLSAVAPYSPLKGHLKSGDVILALDGLDIGVDGKLEYVNERIDFQVVIDQARHGQKLEFRVLRDGKEKLVNVTITPPSTHYSPSNVFTLRPRYFSFGGLIFTAMSRDYLEDWGDKWYYDAPLPMKYLHRYSNVEPQFSGVRDIVVLSGVLPDKINVDATPFRESILESVNGEVIKSLEQLKGVLEAKPEGGLLKLNFWLEGKPLILSWQELSSGNKALLKKYDVTLDQWLGNREQDGAISVGITREKT